MGAVLVVLGVLTGVIGAFAPASGADGDAPVVTPEDGVNGCNGVRPTPGSENTNKRLDPNYPSDFNPGGAVGFIIDYPVDAADVSGRTTFVITDCVFVDDDAVAKYSVSFVPNTTDFALHFAVPIPPGTPLGSQFCNYAKTTAAPSESQASNRKAGPACFTVGGGLRIEKRGGSATGSLLGGASFDVVCSPAVTQPPTIITGLATASHTNADGTVSAAGVSAVGSIAINGPSGTACTVTETAAPAGYQIDPAPRNLVIPIGTAQTVNVFVNSQLGDLVITKVVNGGTGTFTFDVDCDGTAHDDAVSITGTGSATISGIPVGTQCTVTERASALFSAVSVPADGRITIAAGANTVAFTNTRTTGALVVTKTTTGGTGTFTFDVDCDGTDLDRSFTITDSGSDTTTGIPTGTSCTVTERAHADFTSGSVPADGQVTIAAGANTVAFTNVRKTGDLVITKTTTGGSGTFTFDWDCAGTAFDGLVSITDSGSHTVSGIPTGTPCTVTERANAQFTSSSVPADGQVTIAAGSNTVAFTNVRKAGDLVLTKTTTGGSGTFTFDVNCDGTAFDQAVTITDSGSRTISGIPTGTQCTVTERANAQFTSSSAPANGQVTIAAGNNTVAFTNTRTTGSLVVTKTTNGGSGTFTFDVSCDGTAFDQAVTITDSGSRTISGIPTGTVCTVTERPNAEYSSVSLPADGQVTIGAAASTVAFTNTRRTGDLVITKATTGGSGTFTFDVNCDGTAFDQSVTITDSGSRRITGIPTGTSCTVTEQAHGQFTGVSVPADGQVTIVVGDNHVAFTNTRNTGSLVVSKLTNGGTGTFTFDVDCDGSAFDQSFTITDSGSKTVLGIPTGTACTVTERATALFTGVSVPADGKVTIGAAAATVAFTNTAKPTGISLDKKVNGGDHATSGDALVVHGGDALTYTVRIQNTGQVPVTLTALVDTLEPGFAASCPQGLGTTLAPGAAFTCTYQRTASTSVTNTASVDVVDDLGRPSTDTDSTFVTVINPAVTITKTASSASVNPGSDVVFTYTVTNTGDTTLTNVVVTDDILGGIGVLASLAPGAQATLTKTQTIQATSATRNVGTVSGTDLLGRTVTASAVADIAIVLGVTLERLPELPRTGAPIGLMALGGLALVLLGAVLLVGGRALNRRA